MTGGTRKGDEATETERTATSIGATQEGGGGPHTSDGQQREANGATGASQDTGGPNNAPPRA
eukprot:13962922-Heterocapsa_arctica.AAC.1